MPNAGLPEGLTFYWDYDRSILEQDQTIWVAWLRERFGRHALRGLGDILGRMEVRESGWALLFSQGLFGAVEGLSSFTIKLNDNRLEFIEFCKRYFLPEPCPWPGLADAMYGKFRCGLAHGFSIEKGEVSFREDMGVADPVTMIGECFWLDPRWLLDRLTASVEVSMARAAVGGSEEERVFRARFKRILDQACAQPPRKQI